MANFLALLPGSEARSRIRRALALDQVAGVKHRVEFLTSCDEIQERALDGCWNVLLVDPQALDSPAGPELTSLSGRFPSLSVVAYVDLQGTRGEHLLRLGEAGVRAIVLLNVDDQPISLLKTLTSAVTLPAMDGVRDLLDARLCGLLHTLVRPLLERSGRGLTVEELASRHYGSSPRTLRRHFRQAGLPSPSRLIAWCRLFCAVHLLSDPARTTRNVAETLHFSSASALCKAIKRYTGLRPSEVLERGGVSYLLELFADDLPDHVA